MSRKWSPAVEVARDKLFDQLLFSGLPAEERWQMIDAFAHELAEKIRADIIPELDEYGTREQQAEIDGRRGAADLIDPEKS